MKPKKKKSNVVRTIVISLVCFIVLAFLGMKIYIWYEAGRIIDQQLTEEEKLTDQERASNLGLTLLTQEEADVLADDTFDALNGVRTQNGLMPLRTDQNLCIISEKLSMKVNRWADESTLNVVSTGSEYLKTITEEVNILKTYKNLRTYVEAAISTSANPSQIATKWFTTTESPLLKSNTGTHACIKANPNVVILTVAGD